MMRTLAPKSAANMEKPWVADGFEPVWDLFHQMHESGEELGSALNIYLSGQPVADLWGGNANPQKTRPWNRDTMVSIFSISKALTAFCLHHLIDEGKAKLDDLVIAHWPEFASADKANKSKVSIRHILDHSAGLPVAKTNRPGDVFNWARMIRALEHAKLLWPAGTRTAYHAVTFGHLAGEIIRRISGEMPSEYFARNFAGPLGLDLTLRMLAENESRTAVCDGYDWKCKLRCGLFSHLLPWFGGWHAQYFRPCGSDYHPNGRRWRTSEAPAISGFGTAEGLSRLFAMLSAGGVLDGKRVLSEETVRRFLDNAPAFTQDFGTKNKVRVAYGFFYNLPPVAPLGPNPNSLGHAGMGGATAFADPERKIGFGYVCNHLYQPRAKDTSILGDRAVRLAECLYTCIDRLSGSTKATAL